MGEKLGGSFFNCDRCVCPSCDQYKNGSCEVTYDEALDDDLGCCPGDGFIECEGYEECPVDEIWREWDEN